MALSQLVGLATLVAAAIAAVEFPDPADFLASENDNQVGASFSVSKTLGNHMVLQRAPASAVVWGFAPAGTVVTTTFNGANYTSVAGGDAVWRAHLTPTCAGGPYTIGFSASTGEKATLSDVLFGDVYMCGGQSNMEFQLGRNKNAKAYAEEANKYPDIRVFTVGKGTSSKVPLVDLRTLLQPWTRASNASVAPADPHRDYFSAVCWFFGKAVHDGLGGEVPVGLISNNWGGTKVERWMPKETSLPCGHASTGELYNAMIVPYTVGPMAVTGFTWYQGEADYGGIAGRPEQNFNYTCTQAAQITHWRKQFQNPQAFYGIVQLSTWRPPSPELLAELRDQQLASGDIVPNFAYATAADYGYGGNIHPPWKQYPGARLANAALAMVYHQPINWRSPTYAAAVATGVGQVKVWLHDVTDAGLVSKPAHNARFGPCAALNTWKRQECAWASLQFDDEPKSWVNASVAIGVDKMTMVLTAAPPSGATRVIASSYGWGSIPILSVYRADLDGEDAQLPVLPWNRTLTAHPGGRDAQVTMLV